MKKNFLQALISSIENEHIYGHGMERVVYEIDSDYSKNYLTSIKHPHSYGKYNGDIGAYVAAAKRTTSLTPIIHGLSYYHGQSLLLGEDIILGANIGIIKKLQGLDLALSNRKMDNAKETIEYLAKKYEGEIGNKYLSIEDDGFLKEALAREIYTMNDTEIENICKKLSDIKKSGKKIDLKKDNFLFDIAKKEVNFLDLGSENAKYGLPAKANTAYKFYELLKESFKEDIYIPYDDRKEYFNVQENWKNRFLVYAEKYGLGGIGHVTDSIPEEFKRLDCEYEKETKLIELPETIITYRASVEEVFDKAKSVEGPFRK